MKTRVLQLVLLVVIIVLAGLLYQKVAKPALMASERKSRYAASKVELEKLRIIQACWRMKNGRYCSSFDSLMQFVEMGVVPIKQVDKQVLPVRQYLSSLKLDISLYDTLGLIPDLTKQYYHIESGINEAGEPWVEMSASNEVLLFDFPTDFIMESNEAMESKTGFAGLRMGNRYDQRPLQANWE